MRFDEVDSNLFGKIQLHTLQRKATILFQTWETFFAIQCSQPEDSNELFQKLLKDLKELAEYDQSTSTDHPIFLNDNEDHPVQNRESPENSSKENKQNMEKTMLDLVKICHHKQFLCMHDHVDDLIESDLDSKLLSINSINSQRLDKKEQEVKIVEEQPGESRNQIKPGQERLINLVENGNSDSSNDPLLEEVDLFLSDNSIPSGIENVANDPEGDIHFLEELLINDSILSHE
nr:hypothetical protein [Tanacetum cinerariifolium]